MQRAGVPVTAHTSLQIDSVFTALRVLSNAIIKMGNPRAYKKQIDKNNVPYRVWLDPEPPVLNNTFGPMWQYDGIARTVISMALFGEAFWYVLERDNLQYPTTIEVLHPAFMEIKKDKETKSLIYWYGAGTSKVQLDNSNIVDIPFMALPGALRGLNPIQYGGVSFALALAALEFGQRWFAQGASPSFLLSTDQKLGDEEVGRIADKFIVEHSGLQSSHLPLVVDSGLKVEKISSTPDEAQFINTLEYARMCIAAWFGLPSHLVGGTADKGNVWGKTVQEQGIQLVDFTLSGYIVRLEEAYSSLLPRGQFASFNTHAIQQANYTDRAAYITALRTVGVETQNEIRSNELSLGPIEGGDNINAPLNSAPAPGGGAGQQAAVEDSSGGGGGGGF
jgi:HK97 family phage portal protein